MMGRLLFRLARSSLAAFLVGWSFAYFSFALPVKRLKETDTLIAFHHPQPSHPLHILLVPKRARRNLPALSPSDADFSADLWAVVAELVAELNLEAGGYRLVANGGAYQDVPQLHFHLISDDFR